MKDLPENSQVSEFSVRVMPIDCLLVLVFLGLGDVVLLSRPVTGSALSAVFGGLLVAFLPGYAIVSLLFPGRLRAGRGWRSPGSRPGELTERAALSFGISLAVLPLFALGLDATVGFGRAAVVGGLTLLVLAGMTIAAARRSAVPAEQRFRLPVEAWVARAAGALGRSGNATVRPASLVLALLALLAVGGLVAGIVVPTDGETYSTLALLNDSSDGPVAGEYPDELVVGEPTPLVVQVENHEHERTNYTVIVQLQRTRSGDGIAVQERQELQRLRTRLAPGEEWQQRHTITPEAGGDGRRLVYLLYRGDPPAQPTTRNAYRSVHIWVDVDGGGTDGTPDG
jgi:uncharacterized membrane protein